MLTFYKLRAEGLEPRRVPVSRIPVLIDTEVRSAGSLGLMDPIAGVVG